jgi:hypothetical protein
MHISPSNNLVFFITSSLLLRISAHPFSTSTDPIIHRFENYRSLLIEYAYPGLQERARLQERAFPRFRPSTPDSQSSHHPGSDISISDLDSSIPPGSFNSPSSTQPSASSQTVQQSPSCAFSVCQNSRITEADLPDTSAGPQIGGEEGKEQRTGTGETDGIKDNGKAGARVTSAAKTKALNIGMVTVAMTIATLGSM